MTVDIDRTIKKVLEGDIDSFSGIIDRFQRELWGFVSYFIRDRSIIEDIVQKTFVRAYYSLDTFIIEKDFWIWLKAIARNEIRSDLRKTLNEKKKITSYTELVEAETALEDAEKDNMARVKGFFKECLKKLPEQFSEMITQRYTLARSIGEIAESIQSSVNAVTKRLSRARLSLKECIDKMEGKHA